MEAKKTKKPITKKINNTVVPIKPIPASEQAKELRIPLDELYVYKLQLLNKNFDEAKAAIIQPLKRLYEEELVNRINAAIEADPNCKKAFNARIDCINEVLDRAESRLPEGYAVVQISPESGEILAGFNPERAGHRLDRKP